MTFNWEAILWYALLVDSIGACILGTFFMSWYEKKLPLVHKIFPPFSRLVPSLLPTSNLDRQVALQTRSSAWVKQQLWAYKEMHYLSESSSPYFVLIDFPSRNVFR